MKRIIRIIALLSVISLLVFTLGSCQYIETLRTHQAFYTDETEREILFEDHIYKIINPGKLNFIYSDFYDYESNFFVSQKDVPVLIANNEGDYMNVSSNKSLLSIIGDSGNPIWYVREDLYDKAKQTLETAKLDYYNLSWFEYPENDDWYAQVNQNDILVDDDMTALIKRILKTPANERKEYTVLSKGDYMVKAIYLRPCDEDMLITDDTMIYLLRDGNKYYVWDGNEYDEYSICPVKEEDIPAVRAFFDKYESAAQWDDIRWRFENNYYNAGDYEDYNEYPKGVTNSGF